MRAVARQHDKRPPPAPAPPDGARLELLEALLRVEDEEATARLCLEWLSSHAHVRQAVCALLSSDGEMLQGVTGHNVRQASVAQISAEIADRAHPLVQALGADSPVALGRKDSPLPVPSLAVPLRSPDGERDPVGLLVVAGGLPPGPDLLWAAEWLGRRIAQLRNFRITHERRFARERTLFRGIIDAVTDPVLLTDREGKLILANVRAENLRIAKDEDSEGRRRAVSLNNLLFSAALASKAMGMSERARNELLLVDPAEGSDLSFELLSTPVEDEEGSLAIVSVLRNVTDLGLATRQIGESELRLKEAQAEVRSERDRLDLILASVADPIVVADAAGDIVLMNPPAERLLTVRGDDREEVQRRVSANDARFSSFVSSVLFSGDQAVVKGQLNLEDPLTGAPMPVEAVSGKIVSERNELANIVTIFHDQREALERARLYEQLKAASAELEEKVRAATAELAHQNELLRRQAIELEQASAAKSQFLANMSHELRTPLNAVLGYTQMLLQGVSGELSEAQKKSLWRIDSNARHLLEVINEILDITRIEAGRMPLHVSEFRIGELLKEVTAELEPIMARSRVPVQVSVDKGIPPLKTDRQKVKQIVVNLLSNALKFTHEGWIRITVAYDRRARTVSVAVQDTGIGIAPEEHQRVFEDFKQVDPSPTRAYGGTGLGLSISRRLAQMLSGRITLESALGKGSTFTLHVPLRYKR